MNGRYVVTFPFSVLYRHSPSNGLVRLGSRDFQIWVKRRSFGRKMSVYSLHFVCPRVYSKTVLSTQNLSLSKFLPSFEMQRISVSTMCHTNRLARALTFSCMMKKVTLSEQSFSYSRIIRIVVSTNHCIN